MTHKINIFKTQSHEIVPMTPLELLVKFTNNIIYHFSNLRKIRLKILVFHIGNTVTAAAVLNTLVYMQNVELCNEISFSESYFDKM